MSLSSRKGEKESKKRTLSIWQLCRAHTEGGIRKLPFQDLLRHNRDVNCSASLSCVALGMPTRLHLCIKDLEDTLTSAITLSFASSLFSSFPEAFT